MLGIKQTGSFAKTFAFLDTLQELKFLNELDKWGQEGVSALAAATPKRTGLTAQSWDYEIKRSASGDLSLVWKNSNINNGVCIAFIIQYGHGTGSGGYVPGIDYINPALDPVFKHVAHNLEAEIHRANK